MTTFDIAANHLSLIQTILQKYLPPKTTVWVFGSRVHQARKKYSDLDLLLDCQRSKLSSMILMNLREEFDESDLPYKVDIVDWNAITDSFKNHIQNKKILFKT